MFIIFLILVYLEEFNTTKIRDVDLYSIIGLKKGSDKKIEKSFKLFNARKQRIPYPSAKTVRQWKQMEFAYSVLLDPTSKSLYNEYGLAVLNQTEFSIFGYLPEYKITHLNGFYDQSFLHNGGLIIYPLYFTLTDCKNGAVRTIKTIQTVPCHCPRGGNKCAKCRQNPEMSQAMTHKIEVPPGAPDHYRIVVNGIGDEKGARDAVFVCRFFDEKNFTRKGNDLHINKTISLSEAISGGYVEIENLDDEVLNISIGNGVRHGEVKRFTGKGLPVFEDEKRKGDLVVRFNILFPESLSEGQKRKVSDILTDDADQYQ